MSSVIMDEENHDPSGHEHVYDEEPTAGGTPVRPLHTAQHFIKKKEKRKKIHLCGWAKV